MVRPQSRPLTDREYTAAGHQLRQLQSDLMRRRIELVREALAKMDTPDGKIRERRRAERLAKQYERTYEVADRVARDETRNAYENAALGKQRLEAAMNEIYRKPQGAAAHRPDATAPTPGITHGLSAYRKRLCKCDVCRGANAAAAAKYKKARRERDNHERTQHIGETTDTTSAARRSGKDSAEAA